MDLEFQQVVEERQLFFLEETLFLPLKSDKLVGHLRSCIKVI